MYVSFAGEIGSGTEDDEEYRHMCIGIQMYLTLESLGVARMPGIHRQSVHTAPTTSCFFVLEASRQHMCRLPGARQHTSYREHILQSTHFIAPY
jgi:hypothetical protein